MWLHISPSPQTCTESNTLLVNLPERLLGGAVHLELKDIDPVLGPAHGIRPSDRRLYLGLSVVPEQREDQIDDRLKILVICQKSLLAISFILSRMFFR